MTAWTIHHRAETRSTNLDAREGRPGDVFTADFQTAGRGRLDHRWHSARGENLAMSVVLPVAGLGPGLVATLPLAIGLAVVRAVRSLAAGSSPALKWPNDVFVGGRKLAGILCERTGDRVIAGIGVNVRESEFPDAIAARATSLAKLGCRAGVETVRDATLGSLSEVFGRWRTDGFGALLSEIRSVDLLRGRWVSVRRTDDDSTPLTGLCDGISADGSLVVAGRSAYAGEAHVLEGTP